VKQITFSQLTVWKRVSSLKAGTRRVRVEHTGEHEVPVDLVLSWMGLAEWYWCSKSSPSTVEAKKKLKTLADRCETRLVEQKGNSGFSQHVSRVVRQ
jgi:hypothetical protein